jgi:uncharacterized protein
MPYLPKYTANYLQFVVKITKFCNLRCKYCYEYPYLDDPTKMSIEQIEAMFRNIESYCLQNPQIKVLDFIWHGGEPFVIKPDYYIKIKQLQQNILGHLDLEIQNKVQTNLTILDSNYISALQANLFDSIGVSIDLFGENRVNIAGKPIEDKVLNNMQLLLDNDISFGSISVLSRKTYSHVESIFTFFDDSYISCRFLPIYRTGYTGQQDEHSLESFEIVDAYKRIFETWLASENAVEVDPIDNYINTALRIIKDDDSQKKYYDKKVSDGLFIVNTNGDIYSTDEVYEDGANYGNIFNESLNLLVQSEGYKKALERSHIKMVSTCHKCEYFGHCMGFEMAEATNEQLTFNEKGELECNITKPIISYIVKRLNEVEFIADSPKTFISSVHSSVT